MSVYSSQPGFIHYLITIETMKVLQSSIFRAVCAIAIGILLIQNPGNTVTWITVAIGIMFFISGAISCLAFLGAKRTLKGNISVSDSEGNVIARRPTFPIVGIGSLIFGLLIAITPNVFVTWLMYIIGAILILGALNQLLVLVNANKVSRVPVAFWVCPSLILVVGIYVIVKPMATAELPMIILGWCSLLYGVTEIINSLKIHFNQKEIEKEAA